MTKNYSAKRLNTRVVYVATDFKPESEKLCASLAHTYDVLPRNSQLLLTMSESELESALAHDFDRCFASVHTLSDAPLAKPIIEAQVLAARKNAKPRVILAQVSPPTSLLNEGFEWLTSASEVDDHLRRLIEKPPEQKTDGKQPLIYFLCPDRRNKENAEPLLLRLEEKGIHVYPSPLEGPADQALRTHVDALDELDGCLIYYGDIGRDWFDSVFLRIAKKIRQRALRSAIFVAPSATDHKIKDVGHLGVRLVTDPEAAVSAFLAGAS